MICTFATELLHILITLFVIMYIVNVACQNMPKTQLRPLEKALLINMIYAYITKFPSFRSY